MADIAKLVDQLSELTVLEAADLAKALEEKWGVSAAAAVAVAGPAAGGGKQRAAVLGIAFDDEEAGGRHQRSIGGQFRRAILYVEQFTAKLRTEPLNTMQTCVPS